MTDAKPTSNDRQIRSSELSPAAQAVLDAVCANTEPDCDTQHVIAAALRALADQVHHHWDGMECVDHLCAIAAELEGAS